MGASLPTVTARLVVYLTWLAGASSALDKPFNITIGYLPALNALDHVTSGFQGLTISGALTLAVDELNNSTDILPDVKILVEWGNTKTDTVTATRLMTDMSCSGVVAFFGPEGRCQTEAIVAQSRNLPMISYKCFESTPTRPTLAKLESPDVQATRAVISLLRYYRWRKFSIIYEESWQAAAFSLGEYAELNNMTVNHNVPIANVYKCCYYKLNCCVMGNMYKLIRETKDSTRIYVFLGSTDTLVNFMSEMQVHRLIDNGEYMVIFIDTVFHVDAYSAARYLLPLSDRTEWMTNCSVTPALKKQARSLLVINLPEPSQSYVDFTDKVLEYNRLPPFNFPDSEFKTIKFVKKFVSLYATYLYESVKTYAKALDEIIKEEKKENELTYSKLMNIARNGSRIVARMKDIPQYESKYPSIYIKFDDQANSYIDFAVSAFKHAKYFGSTCPYNMINVANFRQQPGKEFPVYKPNPRRVIDWANGVKPEDEPLNGYHNTAGRIQESSAHIALLAIIASGYQFLYNFFLVD